MPIYKVAIQPNTTLDVVTRLIEAKSPAQAIQYVAKSTIKAEKITSKEAFELGKAGIEMEDATSEPSDPPAE